jgi:YaiO family outer membrane protein
MPIDLQLPANPPAQVQPASAPSFDDQYASARALANGGQPELALAAYSALLSRSPGNADVLLGRGIVYARLGRWREAEADLTAAAKASPDYADVWEALGNTYRWSEQPARALEAWERLAALRPQDPAPWLARARAQRAPLPSAGNPDASASAGYTWGASLSAGWTNVGNGPRWNDQGASVRRYMKDGSLAFETLRAHRFGLHDTAWALDAYTGLWQGAYANLRYQHAAASRLFPANAGRIEVWQALGNGWEASLGDDVLGFDSRVNIYGASLAKYAGNFYVQLRHQNIVSSGSHGTGERLLGRWYYLGDADNYLELSANRGRSDDPLSLVGGRARSGGGGAAWVRYFSPQWGGKIGASFSRTASGSDGNSGGDESALNFSLYCRW